MFLPISEMIQIENATIKIYDNAGCFLKSNKNRIDIISKHALIVSIAPHLLMSMGVGFLDKVSTSFVYYKYNKIALWLILQNKGKVKYKNRICHIKG